MYFFTYQIDYVQFMRADPLMNPTDPIDHSIYARDHAQYIAKRLSEESRLNDNVFASTDVLNSLLIAKNY